MMRRILLTILLAFLVLVPLGVMAAPDCPSSGCGAGDVGPFMAGISEVCGEQGTCSLTDIQTVFANVGNWILGIVGALVFLVYVIGGFYFLISGMPGMEKYREKGKTALKMSTLGLVIVFIAFAALTTLRDALTGTGISPGEQYVTCGPGEVNSGGSCALNSTCTDQGICVSTCEQRNESAEITAGIINVYACVDTRESASNYGMASGFNLIGPFETGLCPGDDFVQCGQFSLTL